MTKKAMTSHTFWKKRLLVKGRRLLLKDMIGKKEAAREMNPAYDFKSTLMSTGSFMK
jgi:hypothetical protein